MMTLKQWRKALESWTITNPDRPSRVSPPTDADLDAFEREFDFRLPDSYRRFVMLMGAGMLARHVIFYTPACRPRLFDLIWQNKEKRRWAGQLWSIDTDPNAIPQLDRLIVMAKFVDGDKFYWDPEDVTPGAGNEHGIYLARRVPERAEKVADSFDSFVFDFCLGPRFHDFYGKEERDRSPEGLPMEHWSPVRTRKKMPKKSE